MLDIARWARQVAAALSTTFAGTWAALAALAGAFNIDLAAGKQAATAGIAAAIAAIAASAGNLIRQWREKARWTAEQVARNLNAGL